MSCKNRMRCISNESLLQHDFWRAKKKQAACWTFAAGLEVCCCVGAAHASHVVDPRKIVQLLSNLISNMWPWLIWRPGVVVGISTLFMHSLGIGLELKRLVVEHPLVEISMQSLKSLRDLDNLFLST